MRKDFPFPMNHTEAVVGWVYLFVHIFALGAVVELLASYLLPLVGITLTTSQFNLVYYAISFVFLLVFLFQFLRSSFRLLWSNAAATLASVILGYCLYFLTTYIVAMLINLILGNGVNPNQAAINAETKLNPNTMIVIAVLLAPIVEETLFRGVVFGTLRRKNRFIALLVSTLLFAVYHLWQYMLTDFSWNIVLYLAQYIPAGFVLAWCYEHSKNIWGPVFMHMLVNFVSIRVTLGV